jgi:DNA-binding CsgD family transcriptional regulator
MRINPLDSNQTFLLGKSTFLRPMPTRQQRSSWANVQPVEQGLRVLSKGLKPLGLTQREAEVLVWVAQGKGNYEISVILGAKPRTICKHVEHILSKLNVENRTAAAAVAFTVCKGLFDLL